MAQPIRGSAGELLGVLAILLDVGPLDQMLSSEIGLGETGEVLVATREGDNIVYLFSPRGEGRLTVPLSEVPAMAAALAGERPVHDRQIRGDARAVGLRARGCRPCRGSSVGPAGQDRQARGVRADRRISQQLSFALQCFLVSGGVVASYWVARRLTLPIGRLTAQAAAVARGDFSGRIRTGADDELGVLGTAFNRMTERLTEFRAELEQRVGQRTRDLARTNQELSAEMTAAADSKTALVAGEKRMRSILEATHEAFIGIDSNSIITDWNHQAELTFGWSRDEAIGCSLPDLIIPERFRELHRPRPGAFLGDRIGPDAQSTFGAVGAQPQRAGISGRGHRLGDANRQRLLFRRLSCTTSANARKPNACSTKAKNDSGCWSPGSRTMRSAGSMPQGK